METRERLEAIANELMLLEREKQMLLTKLKREEDQVSAEAQQAVLLEKIAEFEAMKEKMNKELRSHFPSLILPFMLRSENIKSIGITAYAPYFNDGDECVYSVGTDYLFVNGEYQDEIALSDEDKALLKEMSNILSRIPDETYRDVFGNHVMITIKNDGTVDVSKYEHD